MRGNTAFGWKGGEIIKTCVKSIEGRLRDRSRIDP